MRILKGLLLLTIAGALLAYWFTRGGNQNDQGVPKNAAAIAEPVDFSLPDHEGRMIRLSGLKGKPILVNFWASWCPPCVAEFPSLLKFAERAKKEFGVETLAVSLDEEGWKAIDKLFREKKLWPGRPLPLTILLNTDAKVAASYGTDKYPESYFIDRNFKIIRKFVGVQDWMSQEMTKWVMENSK